MQNDWYNRIAKIVQDLKDKLSGRDYKKFKLDLILRIAKRLAEFSMECGECQFYQGELTQIIDNAINLPQATREERKRHFRKTRIVLKHLKKVHRLVEANENTGIYSGIGVGLGAAIGSLIDNVGAGMSIGAILGMLIGKARDKKAKEEKRVI